MKKILFYAANGVGLGHLQRVRLIVEELRFKNIKIILITPAHSPQIFGKFFHHLVKLIPLSDKLLDNPSGTKKARLANNQKFAQALKKFKPDLIVADFYLTSPFTFSAFKYAFDQFPVKSAFIWRLSDSQKFDNDFNNKNYRLNYFQKIILPHNQKELENLLSSSVFKRIKNSNRFEITGPIVKKINRTKIAFCRKKYKISSQDFLIIITLGGGGKLKGGQCDAPDKIIKDFLNIYPRLVEAIPNLKVVVSTGPYLRNLDKKSSRQLKFIKFEKNLPELIKLSKMVISTAGYNTCHELIATKTPAILAPLMRGDKEQFERADYFEKRGVVKVYKSTSSKNLLKTILYCRVNLKKMRNNFKNFSDWQQGNNKIAKIISDMLDQ